MALNNILNYYSLSIIPSFSLLLLYNLAISINYRTFIIPFITIK